MGIAEFGHIQGAGVGLRDSRDSLVVTVRSLPWLPAEGSHFDGKPLVPEAHTLADKDWVLKAKRVASWMTTLVWKVWTTYAKISSYSSALAPARQDVAPLCTTVLFEMEAS